MSAATRIAEPGHAGLDREVLGLDDDREVGGVELDQHLHEVVLVMVMEFEQLDQLGALPGDVDDGVEVGDVERPGVHRGVEHREADRLVDLAVEVVRQHAVGVDRDGGFGDGNGLESCHGVILKMRHEPCC